MLYLKPRDLGVNLRCNSLLCGLDFIASTFRRADNIECTPCQHTSNRIEVRRIGVAAHSRRLKRDLSAPAKRVGDLWTSPKSRHAKLFDKLGKASSRSSQMRVHRA